MLERNGILIIIQNGERRADDDIVDTHALGNALILHLTNNPDIVAQLPVANAVVLILLSMVLTLLGGFIPARKAAKKDPVIALRSE